MNAVGVHHQKQAVSLLLIERMEAGQGDAAPALAVLLVPHARRAIVGVRSLNAPGGRDLPRAPMAVPEPASNPADDQRNGSFNPKNYHTNIV